MATEGQLVPKVWKSEHFNDHPLVGQIMSGAGDVASERSLTKALVNARYVLVGETHTNADHHQIQAHVITALVSLERRPHIVFEMVPRRLSSKFDTLGAQSAPKEWDLALQWTSRGWPAIEMYQPIFDVALQNDLPMLAGNIDRALSRDIARQGMSALSEDQQRSFLLKRSLSKGSQTELLSDLASSHCGLMPKEALPRMADVQRSRDGSMAAAMLRVPQEAQTILIAGSGHVRKDRGVPFYLMAADPKSISVSVGLVEVEDNLKNYSDYLLVNQQGANLYDYVIFTPKADLSDHCLELKKRFKK